MHGAKSLPEPFAHERLEALLQPARPEDEEPPRAPAPAQDAAVDARKEQSPAGGPGLAREDDIWAGYDPERVLRQVRALFDRPETVTAAPPTPVADPPPAFSTAEVRLGSMEPKMVP